MITPDKPQNTFDVQDREKLPDTVVATIWGLFYLLVIGVSLVSLLVSKSMLAAVH